MLIQPTTQYVYVITPLLETRVAAPVGAKLERGVYSLCRIC
jgi:hypothetical protein